MEFNPIIFSDKEGELEIEKCLLKNKQTKTVLLLGRKNVLKQESVLV